METHPSRLPPITINTNMPLSIIAPSSEGAEICVSGLASYHNHPLSQASALASPHSQCEQAHSGTYEDAEIFLLASTPDTAQHLSLLETCDADAVDILG